MKIFKIGIIRVITLKEEEIKSTWKNNRESLSKHQNHEQGVKKEA